MDPIAELIAAADAYIQKAGITRAEFGRRVSGSHQLIKRLESRRVTWKTMQKIHSYIEAQDGKEEAKG